jgi:formylglycine-generating enzyme required for sulfatase activity
MGVFEHAETGLEFVLVPVATFTMGSPEDERGRKDDEPLRNVELRAPFLAARTEVTQRAWVAAMGGNPSRYKGKDRPVESVSWEDAAAFCEKTGLALPTEAQWEYMCRAGSYQRYSGFEREKELDLYAWTKDNAGRKGTSPVGAKRPNGFGLLDVHGNVWEWCADVDPDRADARVYRGGSWRNSARSARCAHRFRGAPDTRDDVLGFRPVFVLTD